MKLRSFCKYIFLVAALVNGQIQHQELPTTSIDNFYQIDAEATVSVRDLKKASRLKKTVETVSKMAYAFNFQPTSWSPPHNLKGPAIFTIAAYLSVGGIGVKRFAKTARDVGFNGDIVLAIFPNSLTRFIDALKEVGAIAYNIEFDCEGVGYSEFCTFKGSTGLKAPINTIRYYLYQIWAMKYDSEGNLNPYIILIISLSYIRFF